MLTFFSTAKPFHGHAGIIQRNALQSWRCLNPEVEVILFGDEDGTAQVCLDLGLRHEPHVERHESGMKYLHYLFDVAQKIARHQYLCYSNCDIIQPPEFYEAVQRACAWKKDFLMVGRRWDIDIAEKLNFETPDWPRRVRDLAKTKGFHQSQDFVDFFVFPRGLYDQIPPLVIGRSFWDHWLVWKGISSGVPVVDCSRYVISIHQNHTYGYHPQGKQGTNEDALARHNFALADKGRHLRSIHEATHAMTAGGKILPTPFRRYVRTLFELCHRHGFLDHTYMLRRRLGLHRDSIHALRRRLIASRERKPPG